MTSSGVGNLDFEQPQPSFALFLLVGIASIGGFLFGYDTGVVSGAMVEIKLPGSGFGKEGLSINEQELVVSCTVAAAAIGSGASGLLQRSPSVGRRTAVMGGSALFAIGAVAMASAQSLLLLVLGRIIVGFAVGVASQVVPIYIAEVAPSHVRGALGVLNNAMIVFGQVVASGVCCAFAHQDMKTGELKGWRWMLGLGMVPAALMFIGLLALPESPRWLLYTRGDEQAALLAMTWLRGSEDLALRELRDIRDGLSPRHGNHSDLLSPFTASEPSLYQRLTTPRVRRALALGVGLQLLQQCVGINTIMYYSATIVQMSQGHGQACNAVRGTQTEMTTDDVSAVCWTVPISSCQLVGNIIGMVVVDKVGRKPLVLGSLLFVAVSLAGLGSAFYPDRGMSWLTLGGMCIYLLSFGIGMSPVPWLVNAEIYPLDERSVANSIATSANWISNFVVSATFLSVAKALSTNRICPEQHPDGAFFLYAGVAFVGVVAICLRMPETSRKTLEEIDALFK